METSLKRIYGEYKGEFILPDSRIYIGVKDDGSEFAQLSFLNQGEMHTDFDGIKSINDEDAVFEIVTYGTAVDVVCKLVEDKLHVHVDISKEMSVDYDMDRVSDNPSYEAQYFVIPESNINTLKENNDYPTDDVEVNYEYEFGNEDVLKFLDEKGFERVKDKSFKSIWKLYTSTCELITQNGFNYSHNRNARGTIAQINYALSQDGFINCRGISIIFCGVLRANGIKSFYEGLMPFNEDDKECHIVNEVFVEEFNKYVLFDASLCSVYKLDGVYLNSIEIKNAIINGRGNDVEIELANDKKHPELIETLAYYSKNIGHLHRCIKSTESLETKDGNLIVLSPASKKDRYKDEGIVTTDINKYFM